MFLISRVTASRARRIWTRSNGAERGEHSIAVLPFVDLSPAKDHDYFSDGIAEEILTALSKIDNLRVAARRSSFWFKSAS